MRQDIANALCQSQVRHAVTAKVGRKEDGHTAHPSEGCICRARTSTRRRYARIPDGRRWKRAGQQRDQEHVGGRRDRTGRASGKHKGREGVLARVARKSFRLASRLISKNCFGLYRSAKRMKSTLTEKLTSVCAESENQIELRGLRGG